MESQRIPIGTEKPYDVVIGRGLIDHCGTYIRDILKPCRIAVISDSNVAPLYLERTEISLKNAGFETHSFVFPAGENSKNLNTLGDILEFLGEIPLTRTDCVVALGGGVTGDMSGFAAGCYLRGIRYIQMPTTFLAAVDSSVGGKTAVNLTSGKNLAGLFLQPEIVLCDLDTFDTLTPEIFADGTAEAIKTAILGSEEMFSIFETENIKDRLPGIVAYCVSEKGRIVTADEKETGLRRLLNLGHTLAHAIEKRSDFQITHGHAVAIGTAAIFRAADKMGWTAEPLADRVINVLSRHNLPTTTEYTAKELYAASLADKKRSGNNLTIVIPEAIGKCVTKTIPIEEWEDIIIKGLED